MTRALRCFAVRRLSPFLGVLQVAETPEARALSPDGEHWEIQVLAPRPEHSWRSGNRFPPVMRFFRFGTWSAEAGLGRVPVSPLFDLDAMLTAARALTEALAQALQRLPFPLGDSHELWLLDAAGDPVALAATTTDPEQMKGLRPQPWAAAPRSDHSFVSPSLQKRGIPPVEDANPRRHASELERLIRQTAGSPARRAWFCSDAPGPRAGGLPLRETWTDPEHRDLVRDYLDWCAPQLLTLPDLSDAMRDRLEHCARHHALAVEAQFRLYPKIINPTLIDAARVEARLRRTSPQLPV